MLPNNHGLFLLFGNIRHHRNVVSFLFTIFVKNSIMAKVKFVEKGRIMREKLKQRIIKYLLLSLTIFLFVIFIPYINLLDNAFNTALIYAGGSIITYYIICVVAYITLLLKNNDADFHLRMMLISIFATVISLFGTIVVLIVKEVFTSNATSDAKIFISLVLLAMVSVGVVLLFLHYKARKRLYIEELEDIVD